MDIRALFPFQVLVQGDSWEIPVRLTDYDSSVWTLSYVFRLAGKPATTLASTPGDDGAFVISATTEQTAAITPGLYSVAAILTSGTKRITAGATGIEVMPDLTSEDLADPRSLARRALDDVEAALAAGAGSDLVEYTVAGTVVKKDRAGLLALRAHYLQRVRTENGRPALGQILHSF